jgi:hypothetical protein
MCSKGPTLDDTGIVDENVEPPVEDHGAFDKSARLHAIREITDKRGHLNPARFQILTRVLELGAVARGQDDVRAQPTELASDRETQAA